MAGGLSLLFPSPVCGPSATQKAVTHGRIGELWSVSVRFSILTLLGLVAFAAAGTAGLLNSQNSLCAELVFSGSLFLLLTSIVAAIYSNGARRSFWVGFAVFGCCYFLLYWNVTGDRAAELVTHRPLRYLSSQLPVPVDVANITDLRKRQSAAFDARMNVLRVGHALWTIILAFVGGLIARYFDALRQKQDAQVADHPASKLSTEQNDR